MGTLFPQCAVAERQRHKLTRAGWDAEESQFVALRQNEYEAGGEGYEYTPPSSAAHSVLTEYLQPVWAWRKINFSLSNAKWRLRSQVVIHYLKRTNSKLAQSFLKLLWSPVSKTWVLDSAEDTPTGGLMSMCWQKRPGIFPRSLNFLLT